MFGHLRIHLATVDALATICNRLQTNAKLVFANAKPIQTTSRRRRRRVKWNSGRASKRFHLRRRLLRRQREPATAHHQRRTRCAHLPHRCCGWRAARARMRNECKPVPTWGGTRASVSVVWGAELDGWEARGRAWRQWADWNEVGEGAR